MKKFIITFSFILLTAAVWAQSAPALPPPLRTTGSNYTDSVRITQNKNNKTVKVNGVMMNSVMDIYENLLLSPKNSMFVAAMRSTGLVGTFKSRGPLTVFLPADSAFLKVPGKGRFDSLQLSANKYELINIITSHVIAGRLTARDISKQINSGKGEASFLTLAGTKLIARIDANRNIVLQDDNGNQSIISQFDIAQNNGILHTITSVLLPKYKAL
jgi:uncharacterized surface protein with fasciclin (FAS1) repeats